MTISQNDVRAREDDRAMIQAATERFLAQGRQVIEIPAGSAVEFADPKADYRAFTINGDKKRQLKSTPKATPKEGRTMKHATAAKSERQKKDREALAARLAELVAQGSTVSEAADALGTTRNRVRRIAKENSITIGQQAQ